MVLAVASIAALAYWDAQRESTAALADFAQEQETLATALAAGLAERLSTVPAGHPAVGALFHGLWRIERPQETAVLFLAPGEQEFVATDGRRVALETARAALVQGRTQMRLARNEAASLGLPARTALVGLARAYRQGDRAPWGVAAIASAERERDREVWAVRRLVLSVLAAAGLVFVFGGLALRKQRHELALQHDLALTQMRQQADERLQAASKAAMLGTLAMGVAHEIATPLGVIGVRAEQLAAKMASDERSLIAIGAIANQVERINQIVRGLLGLARGDVPDAGRVDPRSIVAASIAMVEHRFARVGIDIQTSLPPDLPAITGDARLLEQALINLLLNACDASPPGSSIDVNLAVEGNTLVISVLDRGTGISKADAERVLQPFFTTKAKGQGTGLGLAVAREIVSSHQGSLSIGPISPRGTCAVMRLPVRENAHV